MDRFSLLPVPRRMERLTGELRLGAKLMFVRFPDWAFAGRVPPDPSTGVHVRVGPGAPHASPEAYRLHIGPSQIEIDAAQPIGVLHAARTLAQLCRQAAEPGTHSIALPCLLIEDWPDFPVRGVMLDISRDKVPKPETLRALIDLLGGLKFNQIQLYTEHTFAYSAWPEVWAEASPLTSEEIRGLVDFCAERHIELVPNQNSFGHMERWLKHPRLTHLAETPDAVRAHYATTAFDKSFSLCPLDPGSLDLLASLYDELLPNFTSTQFNVGCDETFELGQGRSAEACAARGKGRVYLDFLLAIHKLVTARGRTMQFWGDIILQHPELLPELPRNMIALEWGYEATHSFDEDTQRFAEAGIPFYVCPGTSSWLSLTGRTANMQANLESAARHGLARGARGFLITDWGDHGHWQQPIVSMSGFAYGAALSWCAATNHAGQLAHALNGCIFDAPAGFGEALLELGNLYQWLATPPNVNGTHYCRALMHADAPLKPEQVFAPEHLEGALADLTRLEHALNVPTQSALFPADLTQRQIGLTLGLTCHGLELLRARGTRGADSTIASLPSAERARLATHLRPLIEEHRRLWLELNRPGGLATSAGRLEALLTLYRA